jgi:hypothetical protein
MPPPPPVLVAQPAEPPQKGAPAQARADLRQSLNEWNVKNQARNADFATKQIMDNTVTGQDISRVQLH